MSGVLNILPENSRFHDLGMPPNSFRGIVTFNPGSKVNLRRSEFGGIQEIVLSYESGGKSSTISIKLAA